MEEMPIWLQLAALAVAMFGAYQASKARADAAINKIADESRADRAAIRSALTAFQLQVATEYATKSGLDSGMNRIVAELQGLRVDTKEGFSTMRTEYNKGLDKLGDRIEKMEEHVFRKGEH